jgi:hypothetical protein
MAQIKITPPKKTGNTPINIQIDGINNETASITIKSPNSGIEIIPPITLSPSGSYTYTRDEWILGTYTVTVNFSQSLPNSLTETFEVLTEADFVIPSITNYPSTIRQMDSFTWTVDNAKPGETLNYTEDGPVTFTSDGISLEANYDYDPPSGYISQTSFFEYVGDYTTTFNFSRSQSVSKIITVTPKIYVAFPTEVQIYQPLIYYISGGEPFEQWTAVIEGPVTLNLSGILDKDGKNSYSVGVLYDIGSYDITFNFEKSGKFKQNLTAISSRVTSILTGTVYWQNPGTYSFTVPINNNVIIEAWGGGGGSGSSKVGGDTIVSFLNNFMYAGGGIGSGGGGNNFFSPAGIGGKAYGGTTNINGNNGGNDYKAYLFGGTGASAPNGGIGGIKGSGSYYIDLRPKVLPTSLYLQQEGTTMDFYASETDLIDPLYETPRNSNGQSPGGGGAGWCRTNTINGASGGGSGAYTSSSLKLAEGTVINFTVGAGAIDWASSGGDGAVKITWS